MMARFYAYINKMFDFRAQMGRLVDSRPEPQIPAAAVFSTAFTMFATCRGSLNAIDKERHFPGRLRGIVGPRIPRGDTIGRVYAQLDSSALGEVLAAIHHRIKRNKMLKNTTEWFFAAVDGHEFCRQPQTLLRSMPDANPDRG
jgi:hypothetical protein